MKTWVCPSGRVSPGLERGVLTIEHMTIRRMEHVGIVVDDLAAAIESFVELGLELHAPANAPGIRHIAFAVEDIDAAVSRLRACGAELVGELERDEDSYRLYYVRGPEGIIVELAGVDGLMGTKRERG
jgi:catechol 2,3-dioxygenase-like lactoylglutathione lyase family enzyme